MRTEHYIEELLYRYNCVVVPEFGAFLTNTASARIDSVSNTLYPPTKIVSFNQQLSKNDGLLVSHISKAKNLSYEDLLEEIIAASKEWKVRLQNGETLDLHGIGTLTMNGEQKIQFTPEEKVNYLASSFGLSAFSAPPILREALKEEVEALEERIPFTITPEKREQKAFRPWLKYAAVFLLLCSVGASGYQFYKQNQIKQQLVQQDTQQQVEKYIQEATFFDTTPLELPALSLKINKKEEEVITGPQHHIIAGAFRVKGNASKKVAQLKKIGYNAKYIGANKFGLHQVAYSSFSDSREALRFLRKIKRTVSQDAWMLSEK